MPLAILDATTRAAVAAATNQTAALEALAAPFVTAGAVTARVYVGATHAATCTHGAWTINTGATPRTMSLGARNARTGIATGTPTRVVFRAGSTDIFEFTAGVGSGDISFAAAISTDAAERIACTVTAPAGLPAAGDGLPAWVPAQGQFANINLNNLSSVNPCPANNCWYSEASGNAAPFRNWNGAAFASGYSQYGALAFWGGGHGGGQDPSIYLFDLTTRQWSRVGPSVPATDFTQSLDTTWYDYLHEGSYIVAGLHSYGYPTYVPPGVAGAGAKGSWMLPQLVGGTALNGATGGAQPHAVDLATGVWTRFTSNLGVTTGAETFASSLYDSIRNRVYWAASGSAVLNYIDYNDAHPRQVKQFTLAGSYGFGLYYGTHVFVPEADMAVGFGPLYATSAVKGEVINFSTGVPVPVFNYTATPWPAQDVASAGFGVDWCPLTQAFYLYEGVISGVGPATRVLKLKPSTLNFATCSWTWSEEAFLNAIGGSVTHQGGQPFTRWRWVPELRCFVWCDGPGATGVCTDGVTRDGIVQLWRPAGT